MKIWEAIVYAILGGITELLPISFLGHSSVFESIFHMSSLYGGDGLYIRAGISLGIVIALSMIFRQETKESRLIFRRLRSGSYRTRRAYREDQGLKTRVLLLSVIGFLPMLISFFFFRKAEHIGKLTYVAGLFAINGFLILICTRGPVGKKGERETNLYDMLLIGLFRMVSVFPGLSSVGTSLCVGRARGLSNSFNIRVTYMITLGFHIFSCVIYLFRGIFTGNLYGRTILSFLIAVALSAISAFFALITFRNLVLKNKLKSFMYYCFDAAAITFIVSIING